MDYYQKYLKYKKKYIELKQQGGIIKPSRCHTKSISECEREHPMCVIFKGYCVGSTANVHEKNEYVNMRECVKKQNENENRTQIIPTKEIESKIKITQNLPNILQMDVINEFLPYKQKFINYSNYLQHILVNVNLVCRLKELDEDEYVVCIEYKNKKGFGPTDIQIGMSETLVQGETFNEGAERGIFEEYKLYINVDNNAFLRDVFEIKNKNSQSIDVQAYFLNVDENTLQNHIKMKDEKTKKFKYDLNPNIAKPSTKSKSFVILHGKLDVINRLFNNVDNYIGNSNYIANRYRPNNSDLITHIQNVKKERNDIKQLLFIRADALVEQIEYFNKSDETMRQNQHVRKRNIEPPTQLNTKSSGIL